MVKDDGTPDKTPSVGDPVEPKMKPNLSGDDLEALDAFCSDVHFEDIDFNEWRDTHQHLDLKLTEYISSKEARCDGEKEICYSRTIKTTQKQQPRIQKSRQKTTVRIKWTGGNWQEKEFIFSAKGDQNDQQTGRLIIRLLVRP